MKTIAATMGVSRTHQYEKCMSNRPEGKHFYHKAQDEQYFALIRKIVDERATYAYYSPESNGIVESFVKTFKRYYVHMNPLNDAKTVLEKIPQWLHDYN